MTTTRPDLGFCISGHAPDGGYVIKVDFEGAARDAGLIDGDAIVSLDGLPLAEFRASEWWPRAQGMPIKVVYQRRGMIHRGNIVVDAFDAPVAAVRAADVPAAAVPEDHAAPDASTALIPADGDVLPSQLSSDNANEFALTFGRPIGSADDQRWRFGRQSMHESGYGRDDALPTPGDVDNWGCIDNWVAPSSRSQAPVVHKRDWYGKR
jgi:hypothetical protein